MNVTTLNYSPSTLFPQVKTPTATDRISKLFLYVTRESGRAFVSVAMGLFKFVILTLQASGIAFLMAVEKIIGLFSTSLKQHVSAWIRDFKEISDIIRHFAEPFENEKLQKADAEKQSPRFIEIQPKWKHEKSVPILYAPGYLDTAETCRDTCRRIANKTGCPVYIVEYRELFQSIVEHAKDVSRVKKRMLQDTKKRSFIFAGHSMGGLATGYSLVKGKGKCRLWITIASPLRGAGLAKLAFGACAKDMKPNSKVIQELHISSKLKRIPSLHVYTVTDQLVREESAKAINNRHAQNYLCKKPCGHLGVRSHPEVEEEIANAIKKSLRCR